MVFSSITFLFLFLPVVLLLSLAVKSAFRNYILLIASIIFYITGEKGYVIIMILSVLMNHLFAKIIGLNRSKDNKTRIVFIVAVASNLLLLCIFKYLNFIVRNINTAISSFDVVINMPYIHLPVGISFFTFQAMSYVIDVYRGEVQVQKKFSNTMLYISLFPQLIAGPIVRYIDIEKQLAGRIMTPALVEEGILRFVTGLGKKVLIANNMALVADGVFNSEIGNLSTPYAWLGIIAYTLQIYFDFSGYSDMAIGLGKIFGFHFLENFNYPYIAKSIKEFWRRWHISLSTWFRDYLYIPLGGNRKGVYRTYINLIIVFFLTGLWHGAEWTFILWGLYHGAFLILERIGFDKYIEGFKIGNIYTLCVVMIGWVIFRSPDIKYAAGFIKLLFSFSFSDRISYEAMRYIDTEFLMFLFTGMLFSMPVIPYIYNRIKRTDISYTRRRLILYFNSLSVLFLCIVYLSKGSYNPFIYFRF